MQRIPSGWTIKFIVFATALVTLEEVVTVAMTNTAPLYGVAMAPAHVTGSANYWDVVLTSSGSVVPMLCIWAMTRYAFSAESAFLMWGVQEPCWRFSTQDRAMCWRSDVGFCAD